MNKQRIAVLTLAILGVSTTFMPWTTLPIIGSMPGTETSLGWASLFLFLIPLMASIIGDKSKSLKGISLIALILASILAACIGCVQLYALTNPPEPEEGDLFAGIFMEHFSIGFGIYVLIITGLALPVFALFLRDPQAKKTTPKVAHSKPKEPVVVEKVQLEEEKIQLEKERIRKEKEDPSRFMPS